MVDKNINKNHDHNLNKNSFSKKNIDDFDKAKLQEFYSSILGNNMEEVKKNSQRLRLKNNSKIDTGDTIFIAEKMEYNRWLALKDALSTASSVAVLLYYFDRVLQN